MVDTNRGAFVAEGAWFSGSDKYYMTLKYPNAAQPLPAYLDFRRLNLGLVLSWTDAGFSLQSAPRVTGMCTNVHGAMIPSTNYVSNSQQFFRLAQ